MIFIATSVCEKVESKGRTTYNEVPCFVEVILLFLFIVFGGSYDIHCMSAYSYLFYTMLMFAVIIVIICLSVCVLMCMC